ncbi:hypothetical protein AO262_01200 [Pseudomonas fluorescens ABAC62]|nr:hypothetical protein AO262_01200 [Pseudomonas fluorescens ABAC62]
MPSMTIAAVLAPVLAPLIAPLINPFIKAVSNSIQGQAKPQPVQQEVDANPLPRVQDIGLTSLRQMALQSLNPYASTAMHINDDSSKDKALGAAITVGGAAMQGIGGRVASSGGVGAKVLGGAMVWGGRAAEEYGKNKYENTDSSTKSTGTYNAYDPNNWGVRSAQR